jgi:hypothetical protein
MSLLDIPREPIREKLKLKILEEDGEDFEAFVEFAKQEQPHATKNNVLQYILEEFFSSSRQDVAAFRDWKEAKKEDAEKAEDANKAEEPDQAEKAEDAEESEKRKNRAKTEALLQKNKLKADKTGEMKVPTPKKEEKSVEPRRRIERTSSSAE